MKVLVTGVAGQLGHDVVNELNKRGIISVGSDISTEYSGAAAEYVAMDITDREIVRTTIAKIKPDAVIHCAA